MKISESEKDGNFHDGGTPPLLNPDRSGEAVEEADRNLELTIDNGQLSIILNRQCTVDS